MKAYLSKETFSTSKQSFSSSSITLAFVSWRVVLFIIAFLAPFFIHDFGARFPYYKETLIDTGLPHWIWGFGNFDGVHYLRIAINGYNSQYTQAFFPLFPLLVSLLTWGNNYLLTGIVFSNLLFFVSLFFLFKLYQFDYDKSISFKALILLLCFPTAFYFGSVYSESLFLLLTVSSLFFLRKQNYLLSGIFAMFASATRLLGLVLVLVILVEFFKTNKIDKKILKNWKAILGIIVAPLGTVFYIIYLQIQFHNPLYFLSAQPFFGAQRSDQPFILLPQVLYRYSKILLTVSSNTLAFFNALLEVIFTITPLGIVLIALKKVRVSYLAFTLLALIIPTLTGTLSSMPRYALMSFLLFPFMTQISGKYFYLLLLLLAILQVILLTLFIQGYWVA